MWELVYGSAVRSLILALVIVMCGGCDLEHNHQCGTNCIPQLWVCDGDFDCVDKTDEINCVNRTCDREEFRCVENHNCIPRYWYCDGENDCSEGSDEQGCANVTCPEDTWSCSSTGPCIPMSFVCDGHSDCRSSSDEDIQICSTKTCEDDEFRCAYDHRCISKRWLCDSDFDCNDKSDELNCTNRLCPKDEWKCSNSSLCIPESWRCDGGIDCVDQSDELTCAESGGLNTHKCDDGEFSCNSSNQCIHQQWVCDGDVDCTDGSDESNCHGQITCSTGMFQCHRNGACILGSFVCDGQPHCSDNSDEQFCTSECDADTQYDCSLNRTGRNCIPVSKLCDGQNDCGAFEDEQLHFCNKSIVNPCRLPDKGGCEYGCVFTHVSHYCTCRPGYMLAEDNKHCLDVNECEPAPGICSHVCENKKGSYKCSCHPGYVLDQLNRDSCIAGGAEPKLMFTNVHEIREFGVRTSEYRSVMNNSLHRAVAFDYDYANGLIFWSDTSAHKIFGWNNTVGNKVVTLWENKLLDVKGLAFDWIHRNLYWTDSTKNTIEMLSLSASVALEPKWHRSLIQSNLDSPRSIVVDPRADKYFIFWTNCGHSSSIERAFLNGSSRTVIVAPNAPDVVSPTGLTIDYESNQLYWVDAKLRVIQRTDYSGSRRIIIYSFGSVSTVGHLTAPLAISVFEEYLYWSDHQTVWKIDKVQNTRGLSSNRSRLATSRMGTIHDVRVYHALRQPTGNNSCLNTPCTHLCLAKHEYPQFTCVCPDDDRRVGYYLDSLGFRCLVTRFIPDSEANHTAVTNSTGGESSHMKDTMFGTGELAGIVAGVLIFTVIIGAIVCIYAKRMYKRRTLKSLKFDNPVYRTKEAEDQFAIQNTQVQPSSVFPDQLSEPLTSSMEYTMTSEQ